MSTLQPAWNSGMASFLGTLGIIAIWGAYLAIFIWLARKGRGHDSALAGSVSFTVQAFAYVATYLSAVALVGFGGLAHAYGLQMLLVAAGNVWLGTWLVYRFLAWPTREWREKLDARSPAALIGLGHNSLWLTRALALVFAIFLGVYASAVIKGAAILLAQISPLPEWALVWIVALIVGFCVRTGGLRGVIYTEAMQGAVMLLGIVMIAGAVFYRVGGPLAGVKALGELPATDLANNGFTALSSGGSGLFILSLVAVTSVAVWAQPQMIQRHFAVSSKKQLTRSTWMAMLALTILVGGTYFAASLSRLILPEVSSPDMVMPTLVNMLLPAAGKHLFVLAIVSASLSTATALFHIAGGALAEDVPARKAGPKAWWLAIGVCILVSGSCAQIKGQLISLLCTTSWSVVGATALVPYLALILWNRRSAIAAWCSAVAGFGGSMVWYLCAYAPTAIIHPFMESGSQIPPFFAGLFFSCAGWCLGVVLEKTTLASGHASGHASGQASGKYNGKHDSRHKDSTV